MTSTSSRSDAVGNNLGYFMVLLPDHNEYQGYFLQTGPAIEAEASRLLSLATGELASRFMQPAAVIEPLQKLSDADQVTLGVLSAVLAEYAIRANALGIAGAALAVAKLTSQRFWWISAIIDKSGTRTSFYPLAFVIEEVTPGLRLPVPVDTVDRARLAIAQLPEVVALLKRRNGQPSKSRRH